MAKRLIGKAAVVTGSGSGIGAAIARRFAAESAAVIVHDHPVHQVRAQAVAAGIRESGGDARCLVEDLAGPDACRRLIADAASDLGRIDILVNNAAVMTRGDLLQTDAELFDRTIAVNARAPLLLIQAALEHLQAAGGGAAVLNIGSVNGYCGESNQLAYAMSKGALMTLSRNLADALAPRHIRVNHFNLGWILSDSEYSLKLQEGLPADWPSNVPEAFAPSGRLLSPDEIAGFAVAFVESDGGPVSGAVVDLEQYPIIGRNPRKE